MAENIKHNAPAKSKTAMAKELGVSRASLYYLPKLPAKDQQLKTAIEAVMAEHRAYGHKRIAIALNINKKRILRVMKLFRLKTKRHRKAPKKPKDIKQEPMNIPNLLINTALTRTNQAYASDFTYLPFHGKFVYLATFEDLFTREIVGWDVATRHTAELVNSALDKSLDNDDCPEFVHSDQGSEYRSQKYLQTLKIYGIKPSMSAKGSPWQNGCQEAFYSEFKLELGHPDAYETLGELIEAIALQIYYYNCQRIHSALKCPPAVFKQKCQNKMIIKEEIINLISQPNTVRLTV